MLNFKTTATNFVPVTYAKSQKSLKLQMQAGWVIKGLCIELGRSRLVSRGDPTDWETARKVVALSPTRTVHGLACHSFSQAGIERKFKLLNCSAFSTHQLPDFRSHSCQILIERGRLNTPCSFILPNCQLFGPKTILDTSVTIKCLLTIGIVYFLWVRTLITERGRTAPVHLIS